MAINDGGKKMTVYDFMSYIMDGVRIEIYDFGKGKSVFEGYPEDIPEEYEGRTLSSVEAFGSVLVLNVEED